MGAPVSMQDHMHTRKQVPLGSTQRKGPSPPANCSHMHTRHKGSAQQRKGGTQQATHPLLLPAAATTNTPEATKASTTALRAAL